jgi:hypothetical protein
MDVDFGVQVVRAFEADGEVFSTETPAGEVARIVHVDPHDKLGAAHDAIHAADATRAGRARMDVAALLRSA